MIFSTFISTRAAQNDGPKRHSVSLPSPNLTNDVTNESSFSRLEYVVCPQCIPVRGNNITTFSLVRLEVHLNLEHSSYSRISSILQTFIIFLIIISTISFILSTIRSWEKSSVWDVLEIIVSICFTAEYSLRLISSYDVKKFMLDPLNFVDFLAILPFFIELAVAEGGDVSTIRVFRIIRLIRIFRLLKISRYLEFLGLFRETLIQSQDALFVLLAFVLIAMVVFSSLIFAIEAGDYDEESGQYLRSDGSVSPFENIPVSFYWCLTTITTVGYGDLYPVENWGRFVANLTMFTGVFALALPLAIIGSVFQHLWEIHKAENELKLKIQEQATKNRKKSIASDDALVSAAPEYVTEFVEDAKIFLKAIERASCIMSGLRSEDLRRSVVERTKDSISSEIQVIVSCLVSAMEDDDSLTNSHPDVIGRDAMIVSKSIDVKALETASEQ